MPTRLNVVAILKQQLREAKATIDRLHHAILALERLGRTGRRSRRRDIGCRSQTDRCRTAKTMGQAAAGEEEIGQAGPGQRKTSLGSW